MWRKVAFLIITLPIALSFFAASAWAGTYSGGDGTSGSPYRIADADDWQELMVTSADWSKRFILIADVDLAVVTVTPVGNFTVAEFSGVFDGSNHVIRNVTINLPSTSYVGLFGYVDFGGQIKNLGVENVNITGSSVVGGLVGYSYDGSITSCYSTGSVSGSTAGGLIGRNKFCTVTSCYSTASVTGGSYVGGFVGIGYNYPITSCCSTGPVSGTSSVGGFVGYNMSPSTITSCYSRGPVSGNSNVGGFVGDNEYTIISCYSTGFVSGTSSVGGFAGYNDFAMGDITSSFWDTQTSERPTSAGGTGKTTAQMKTQSTFTDAGWNFSSVWKMLRPNEDYPRLIWQEIFPGDIAGLYGVDYEDLEELVDHWLQSGCPTGCEGADIYTSGSVDFYDYAILASDWLNFYVQIQPATTPNPADGATGVARKPILSWMAGYGALHHDVYFGTDFNEVNDADISSAVYQGRQDAASWDSNSLDPTGLALNTVYYWRIDEVGVTMTCKGDIWSFTTMSGKASSPSPANGAGGVDPNNITLAWTAAPYATAHDVYIGTSFADVNSSITPVATTIAVSYDPGTLNYATTYYWRIDEFDGTVTVKGDIWSFTTCTQAAGPGLVGWWKLDETSGTTASDSAGANHGTLNGNPVWTSGQIDGALAFDGTDDYVDCGNSTSLDITGSISISAWVKFNNLSGYRTVLAKRGGVSDSISNYALRTNANKLEFYYKNGTTWHVYTTSNANLSSGNWYHIAATFTYGTGSSIKCYRNGVPLTGAWTMGNGNAPATTNTNPLTIGALTNDERINGTIDDVHIYNRALSAAEILTMYLGGKAFNPNPSVGAANIDTQSVLTWSAGTGAVEHDVYLGTSFADVNSSETPVTTTSVASYSPGTLNYSNTYYWRIDEYDGSVTVKGDIWSFTTISGKASNPSPANAAPSVDPHTTLSWSAAPYATSHDVYIGTSFADVNSSTTPVATTIVASYDPGTLNYVTTYYWRIDEDDGVVTIKGDIWSFTTMSGKASNPAPASGAGGVDPNNITLAWTAAPYATAHDVYIGTSFADVNSSTTPVTTTSVASYNPGALNYAATYYWRIDEFDGDVTVKGNIWNFTTWAQLDPNLGLVAWWKLDETSGTIAYDSNSTNHGTLNGNPVWTTGQINGALAFDGTDDYVDCGNSTSLDITGSISISTWVKFNSLSSYRTILAKRGGVSDSISNYALRANANKLEFYYKNGTTWHIYATSNANLSSGNWYHIAATFTYGTGSSIKCYRNGALLTGSWTNGNGNAAATTNTKPLTIGALTNDERINGTIDDVRIYNRALSGTDVQQLYQAGLP